MNVNIILEWIVIASALVAVFMTLQLARYVVRDSVIDSIDRVGEKRKTPVLVSILFVAVAIFASLSSIRSGEGEANGIFLAVFVGLLVLASAALGTRSMVLYHQNLALAASARAERERAEADARTKKRKLSLRR